MKRVKWIYAYVLKEPFRWMYWCFFQPVRFVQEVESIEAPKRIVPMVRLILPLFLTLLGIETLLFFPTGAALFPLNIFVSLALCVLWGTVENVATGIISGIFLGFVLSLLWLIGPGVGLGIEASLALGIIASLKRDFAGFSIRHLLGRLFVGAWWVSIGTLLLPIYFVFWSALLSIAAVGILWICFLMFANATSNDLIVGHVGSNIAGVIGIGMIMGQSGSMLYRYLLRVVFFSTAKRAFLWILLMGMLLGGLLSIGVQQVGMGVVIKQVKPGMTNIVNDVLDSAQKTGYVGSLDATATAQASHLPMPISPPPPAPTPSNIVVPLSIAFALALGLIMCILSYIVGGIVGLRIGIQEWLRSDLVNKVLWDVFVCSLVWGSLSGLLAGYFWGFWDGVSLGLVDCLCFNVAYVVNQYNIPLYSLGIISQFGMFRKSKKEPSRIFNNLHSSWLYASDDICLLLPFLQEVLLIALEEDVNSTLQELQFLIVKKPHQKDVARTILREYALQIVDAPKTLRDIAELSWQLNSFLSEWKEFIDRIWSKRFTAMGRACKDASDYQMAVSWQARIEALESMKLALERCQGMKSTIESPSPTNLRHRTNLLAIIDRWLSVVQHELDRLEQDRPENDQISNPYVPGAVLALGTTLFVGRQDLAIQLERALARGNHRPTFFLNGERRMGKSSTLRQLPNLLSKRYVPIYYDLQNPGSISSTTALLSEMATEIYRGLATRGIRVDDIASIDVQKGAPQNEAASYAVFDAWLDKVEKKLEFSGRTLLLTFDEFEKLEDAGKANYLDLKLLLNWFRSTIQNRSRIGLLFSGLHTLGEMSSETGINWAGYFVNVQTVKVSFLQQDEAFQLITRPVPDFLGAQIFGDDVIDEIIHVTGCHPFLVQAVCSVLIDNLNADRRFTAEMQDVTNAVKLLFERWWDSYFRDLWERTDINQRTCLIALYALGEGNDLQIMQQSGLENHTVRGALQRLCQRDLVLVEDERYRIAAPIFGAWVERNN